MQVERNAATAMAQTSDVSQRDNYFRYAFKEVTSGRGMDKLFIHSYSLVS